MSCSNSLSITFDSSDDDSSTLFSKSSYSVIRTADESSTNLHQSSDKQCVLYLVADIVMINLFQTWWNLTSFDVKLKQQRQVSIWRIKSTDDISVWSHYHEKVNVMQKESKILYKYY